MYQVEFDLIGSEIRNKRVIYHLAGQLIDLAEITKAASEEFSGVPLKDLKLSFQFFPEQKGLFALKSLVISLLYNPQ